MKVLSKLLLVFVLGSVGLFAQAPDTAWTRTYGGTNSDRGNSVQQTTDGGYIVVGSTAAGGTDVYLIKTNSLGDTLWTRTYGGNNQDWGSSAQQTTDGGYIVVGYTQSYSAGGSAVYLIKTNGSGDTLWTRTYGGTDDGEGSSVQQTSDGGYVVAGWTGSIAAASYDVYLIKTDSSGDTLWTRAYGGTNSDRGNSVQQTTDGGYIVAGYTYSYGAGNQDVYLIKTNSLGDTLWTRTYGGTDYDYGRSVQQTSDGGYIVVGEIGSHGTGRQGVYLIKLKPEESGIEEEIATGLFSLSPADPNPFTSETMVSYELPRETDLSVSVYNMLGQKVRDLYSGKQFSGIHEITWNGTGNSEEKLASGTYLLKIKGEGEEASTKVMFVR